MRICCYKASKNNFLKDFYKYKIIQLYTDASDKGIRESRNILCEYRYYPYLNYFANNPVTKSIVLSACDSQRKSIYGRGVFSFSRGFAALGISWLP